MDTFTTPEFVPQITEYAEEQYHAPLDYLQASNRRKNVALLLLGLLLCGLTLAVVKLALKDKPTYVVAIAPNGEEYVLSTPSKALDLRDYFVYKQTIQDLRDFSESYFERSAVTAQKDYEKARWFLPDSLLGVYDSAALGDKGWIAGLQSHILPESHARIDGIELRSSDIIKEPYQARIYLTRTATTGIATHTIATLTFVLRPAQMAENHTRLPLYNALGVFIVKPVEETADFRK